MRSGNGGIPGLAYLLTLSALQLRSDIHSALLTSGLSPSPARYTLLCGTTVFVNAFNFYSKLLYYNKIQMSIVFEKDKKYFLFIKTSTRYCHRRFLLQYRTYHQTHKFHPTSCRYSYFRPSLQTEYAYYLHYP